MASESLLRILQHNLAQTQRSLMRLNAISVIIMIITMQRSMIGLYSTGSPQSIRRRGSHSAHLFRAARFTALAVFVRCTQCLLGTFVQVRLQRS